MTALYTHVYACLFGPTTCGKFQMSTFKYFTKINIVKNMKASGGLLCQSHDTVKNMKASGGLLCQSRDTVKNMKASGGLLCQSAGSATRSKDD